MSKAFARIPANVIEKWLKHAMDIPDKLEAALEEAIIEARNGNCDGEAPIKVFIVDDTNDDEKDDE